MLLRIAEISDVVRRLFDVEPSRHSFLIVYNAELQKKILQKLKVSVSDPKVAEKIPDKFVETDFQIPTKRFEDFSARFPGVGSLFKDLKYYEEFFGNNDGILDRKDFAMGEKIESQESRNRRTSIYITIYNLTSANVPEVRTKLQSLIAECGPVYCYGRVSPDFDSLLKDLEIMGRALGHEGQMDPDELRGVRSKCTNSKEKNSELCKAMKDFDFQVK